MTVEPRPKRYPAPEFPARRAPAFATTPPAIFPVLLGLCGLAIGLRAGLSWLGLPAAPADLAAGVALGLWLFGVLAYGLKLRRRPSVIFDDLKVLPSRAGLAAASMGGMASAALLAPYSSQAAMALLLASLLAHGVLALLTLRVLASLSAEARVVNPGWHLSFVGFIVAAPAAIALGQDGLARGLFWATLPIAIAIWSLSGRQLWQRIPPAPLRPMLAMHLAPAALFAIVATGLELGGFAMVFHVWMVLILVALGIGLRWITTAGFSALWGGFTFPLTAAATALLVQGGPVAWAGIALLVTALGIVPFLAWKVLKLWAGGQLAAKTNAAEA
jgi:tellurite resistance protein